MTDGPVGLERVHLSRARQRNLVDRAVAGDDPSSLGAVRGEHPHHLRGHGRVTDADDIATHSCRVGERPEDIEHGRYADLGAYGRGEAHRRVEGAGESKAHAGFVDAPGDQVGRDFDRHSEQLEEIERA